MSTQRHLQSTTGTSVRKWRDVRKKRRSLMTEFMVIPSIIIAVVFFIGVTYFNKVIFGLLSPADPNARDDIMRLHRIDSTRLEMAIETEPPPSPEMAVAQFHQERQLQTDTVIPPVLVPSLEEFEAMSGQTDLPLHPLSLPVLELPEAVPSAGPDGNR